jgi:hypothetical protein
MTAAGMPRAARWPIAPPVACDRQLGTPGRGRGLAGLRGRAGLAPRGRVGLQAITMPHDRMLATRGGHTWIHNGGFRAGYLDVHQLMLERDW